MVYISIVGEKGGLIKEGCVVEVDFRYYCMKDVKIIFYCFCNLYVFYWIFIGFND